MIRRLRKNHYLLLSRDDGQVPFRIVKEMHRSNPWALDWLRRYDKDGIEGLKDRTKSGRLPEMSEEISCSIKKNYPIPNSRAVPQSKWKS